LNVCVCGPAGFVCGLPLNACVCTIYDFWCFWCCYIEFSPTEIIACVFRSRTAVAPLERLKILLQVRSPIVFHPLNMILFTSIGARAHK
jgi:hypothetical protein